jgi:nitrate reductase gamma subunit
MDQIAPWIAYAALLVFVIAVVVRFVRIQRMPRQVRWEIYPLPHEGERAKHGGSRMEELDHWEKPQHKDRVAEVRFMIPEMIFLKGLWDHNRKLWYRSFPFHFGLYLLVAFAVVVLVNAALSLAGVGPLAILSAVAAGLFAVGAALGLVGALGLLAMRAFDGHMRPYTNPSHFFNLLVFLVVLGLQAAVFVTAGFDVEIFRSWAVALLTADAGALVGGALATWTLVLTVLLVAYIPLTHMSHFFVKWFTWHQIRWDDEPNVRGGRIEKMIEKALSAPVTWSAPHIGADGKKTWADVATEEVRDQ